MANITKYTEMMEYKRVRKLYTCEEGALFEDYFFSSVRDKSDLTNKEINLYISLAKENIITVRLTKILEGLDKQVDLFSKTATVKERKIYERLCDLIMDFRLFLDKNKTNLTKTMEEIFSIREIIEKKRLKNNTLFLDLINKWADRDKREALIKMAVKKKKKS